MSLDALLTPASVAVVGASRTPGKVGHDILANLVAGGFAGRILPVNPAAREILGLPCFADGGGGGARSTSASSSCRPPRWRTRSRTASAPARAPSP